MLARRTGENLEVVECGDWAISKEKYEDSRVGEMMISVRVDPYRGWADLPHRPPCYHPKCDQ